MVGVTLTPPDMTRNSLHSSGRRRISGFDYFIIAGGLVNLVIIVFLVGFWFFSP